MTRRQALIAAAVAAPGAILAATNESNSIMFSLPPSRPQEIIFEKDCFSLLRFKTDGEDIVVKWSEVIEALR